MHDKTLMYEKRIARADLRHQLPCFGGRPKGVGKSCFDLGNAPQMNVARVAAEFGLCKPVSFFHRCFVPQIEIGKGQSLGRFSKIRCKGCIDRAMAFDRHGVPVKPVGQGLTGKVQCDRQCPEKHSVERAIIMQGHRIQPFYDKWPRIGRPPAKSQIAPQSLRLELDRSFQRQTVANCHEIAALLCIDLSEAETDQIGVCSLDRTGRAGE
jgi:hypothetical protein